MDRHAPTDVVYIHAMNCNPQVDYYLGTIQKHLTHSNNTSEKNSCPQLWQTVFSFRAVASLLLRDVLQLVCHRLYSSGEQEPHWLLDTSAALGLN